MSLLKRIAGWVKDDLTRSQQPPARPGAGRVDVKSAFKGAALGVEVAGESHHEADIARLVGPKSEGGVSAYLAAELVPEPANQHDRNAVRVMIQDRHVGYLFRDAAAAYSEAMVAKGLAGATLTGVRVWIHAGWKRPEGDTSYSVTLFLPEEPAVRLGAQPAEPVATKPRTESVQRGGQDLLRLDVIGEASCQPALASLVPADARDEKASVWVTAALVPRPDGVVIAEVNGHMVGWLPEVQARRFKLLVAEMGTPEGKLDGIVAEVRGGKRDDGRPALYGLALYLPPDIVQRVVGKRRAR